MKRLLLAGALALALLPSLAACATDPATGSSIISVGTGTVAESKTVAAAEIAYTQAAQLETLWLQSGKATPAQAKMAKALEGAAYATVVAGRTAVANNDSAAIAVSMKLFNQALPAFTGYLASNGAKL